MVVMTAPISTTNMTGFLATSARVELDERLADGRADERTLEDAAGAGLAGRGELFALVGLGRARVGGTRPRVGSASRSGPTGRAVDVVATVRGECLVSSGMCCRCPRRCGRR